MAVTTVPTGSVSLMFTDIEGSTKLLERLRDRYAVVLEQHRAILRAAFDRHGGFEVDTQGDSFFVAFGSPAQAVECALEIQRELSSHDWPDGEPVRVRIGIHTGEPTVAATGYVGIDVHRGARVGAAAHGGQVLVSEMTRRALDGVLPAALELAPLGVFRFKGLAEPLAVSELRAPGLATDFPQIRTSAPEDEPPADGEPPYKGLLRFEEEDADLFFGRESVIAQVIETVRTQAFLAVVGASGSGKSSLIRAGVIPALSSEAGWRTVVMTPTAHPAAALSGALGDEAEPDPLRALADAATPTVLVVDQFEELFTLCRDDAARRAFVSGLVAAAGGRLHVLLTLRADFYAEVAEFPELRERIAEHQLYIGPMEPDDVRRAIEQPARLGGWEIAPGLVDLLVRDIGSEPGALPLLSHALLETWRRRRGSRMTLKGYFESGEVRGAIARTADRLYAELAPEAQQMAREILLRLTELGEGTQDTRRRASLDELVPAGVPSDAEAAGDVLRRMIDARLVTVDEGAAEVAHEALIREWPLLREWLLEDREGLRTQRQIAEAAGEWRSLGREPSLLFRGARLATAREWAEAHRRALNAREQAFLDASVEAEERDERERAEQQRRELEAAQRAAEAERLRAEEQAAANRRLRRRAVILAGAVIMSVGLGVAAVVFAGQASEQAAQAGVEAVRADEQRRLADEQRALAEEREQEADKERRTALSRQLAAQALASLTNLDVSLLLSLEAIRAADTVEARTSLFTGMVAEPRLQRFLVGNEAGPVNVAFNSNGRTLASSSGATVILWDVVTGQPIGEPLSTGDLSFVTTIAFSPDGRTLASGHDNGSVFLWDVETRQLIGEPLVSKAAREVGIQLTSVAFSPDGRTLAAGSDDGTVVLWDVETREPIGEPLAGDALVVRSVAFSADGRTLAAGSDDGTVVLWDVETRQPIGEPLAGHEAVVRSVAFSADGRTLAAGSDDGTVVLWDVETRQPIGEPLPPAANGAVVTSVAFSPDGRTLAAGSDDGTVVLWDVETREPIGEPLAGDALVVRSVAFSPDGRTLAAGGDASRMMTSPPPEWRAPVILWDLETRQPIGELPGGGSGPVVTFSPDGRTLASGSDDGSVILWDLETRGRISAPLAPDAAEVSSVAFSPDGRTLASGGNTVILWDVETRQPIREPLPPAANGAVVTSVAFSPDGRTLAAGSDDGTVVLWDVETREPIGEPLAGDALVVRSVAFSPDGRTLAAGGDASRMMTSPPPEWRAPVILWDLETRQPIGELPGGGSGPVVTFSPDGRTLASGSDDGSVILWDLETRRPIGEPLYGGAGASVTFSPDGRTLASGSHEGTITLWDVKARQPIGAPLVGNAAIVRIAFSPDGRTLASGSRDGTVSLWDVETRQPIGALQAGTQAEVSAVAFSPDGRTLASSTFDDTVILWDVEVESWKRTACQVAGRSLSESEWQRYFGTEPYRETCPDR